MKRSMDHIQTLEQNLATLIEHFNEPTLYLSDQQKILHLNSPAAALFEASPQTLIHKSLPRQLLKCRLKTSLPRNLSKITQEQEVILTPSSPDPSPWCTFQWSITPFFNDQKVPLGFLFIGKNATSSAISTRTPDSAYQQAFNLKQFMVQFLESCPCQKEGKSIKVLLNYFDHVPEIVIGDLESLQIVLTELIQSALKYTDHEPLWIVVDLMERNQNDIKLRLSVHEESSLPDSPVSTHEPQQKDLHQHVELNLHGTKRLIEAMRGTIQMNSIVDQGAVFAIIVHFHLPVEAPQTREADQKTVSASSPSHIKILVIEDDVICRNLVKDMLQELNYQVDVAGTAKEAIDQIRNPYDVILMDIGLPDKDGMTLTRELRSQFNIASPVIAMTAYEWNRDLYHQRGFNGLLKKPISRDRLKHILFRVLNDPNQKR